MAEERVQRRLAAILAADVAGYSRLVGLDERDTLARFKGLRRELVDPKIDEHRGRIVKTTGDGLLAEFASVIDALHCAIEVQRGMQERSREVDLEKRIVFRIGINVGDVVFDGGDIYGDGVNVAARLEALAEPGGICVSGRVQEDARGKLDIAFEDAGEQQLKNIAWPVRVFRVQLAGKAEPPRPVLALPDKPSIAVLPFDNMSAESDQVYFSDGITEDIITDLSRFRSLFVIARNSSFQFRSNATDVRRIGRELGVRYVVEGSVRKGGERLRITAQLIDATTGNHLWAERYDRNMADVFAVQDEVVQAIVARIAGHLTIFEFEKVRRKRTEHLGAYDCFLRGLDLWRTTGPDASAKFMPWLEKSLDLDPQYAEPLTRLSISLAIQALYNDDYTNGFERALAMANKAVLVDPDNSWSHCALAVVKLVSGSLAASANHFETAMRLNPNDPDQMVWRANYYTYMGNFTAARNIIEAAERLNPMPPPWYEVGKAMAEYGLRHYSSAASLLESLGSNIDCWDHCYLAASYERLGRVQAANAEIAKALKMKANLSVKNVISWEPYASPGDLDHLLEPLRRVGLPE
jgi:adenylate cyclase